MKILGIAGCKHNGKDTVADYLILKYGYKKYSFADPIKRGCMELFGFSEEQMWGSKKEVIDENWNVTPRKILQILGTELLQLDIHNYLNEGELPFGRKIWVQRFKTWYDSQDKDDLLLVIPDIRFAHEVEAIKEMGGTIIRVVRPDIDNSDMHDSEKNILNLDVDSEIINDGGLNDLFYKVDEFIKNNLIIHE
jgi:hypothetical protein